MVSVTIPPAARRLDKKQLANALSSLRRGDFSVRMAPGLKGVDGEIAEEFNALVEINQRLVLELDRISQNVGKQGQISQRANIGKVTGAWQDAISSVNSLVNDLVHPTSEMARVIGAVAKGDLSQSMALEIQGRPLEGEFLRIAKTVNIMVDQLSSFASEVTRVAREVGTEGKLGGQADVRGVSGTWKDLTDNVNFMAGNLTGQVRNIADVTKAVANGDLSKKITVDVRGEILELKNTVNTMVDQLSSFAAEVTRVAREVGTEGKLGGQADVRGVAGTWKDLTDSVNSMAGNLTGQVRGIAKVVTAVANGNLKQKLTVDAKGEIAELADTINNMIDTLATFAEQVATQPDKGARHVEFIVGEFPTVKGDAAMLLQVFVNPLSNAVKFTSTRELARIEVGCNRTQNPPVFFMRDNGVGFDRKYSNKLFGVFERLHAREAFDGTGIGLATVQKIVQRHGGNVWAEAAVDQGAGFYFTLPD